MKLKMQGSESVEVAESAFGVDFNEPLVHQVVTAFLAGSRAGTKAQKNRAAVAQSHGGRKARAERGRAPFAARYGWAVDVRLLRVPETTRRKLIERCIAAH